MDSVGTSWTVLSTPSAGESFVSVVPTDDHERETAGHAPGHAPGQYVDLSLYTRRVRIYRDGLLRHHAAETPWTMAP